MPEATLQQVQQWSNERTRPRCNAMLDLLDKVDADRSPLFDDIYLALSDQNFEFTDDRGDSPPHMAEKSDLLSINTSAEALRLLRSGPGQAISDEIANSGLSAEAKAHCASLFAFADQWPIVEKLSTRS